MSAYNTLPSPAPRAARLASLVVVLLVGLTGLIGLAPPATAVAGATVTGRFVTDDGVPIDAIRALLIANNAIVTEVTTGADGTFELTGVPAGTYTLEGSDLFDNYSLVPGVPLTVADGETKALGDLELDYFTGMRPATRLTGFVRDASGMPVRGIQVLTRTTTALQSESQITGLAVTDRTGRFYFDSSDVGGPEAGTYKLHFGDRHVLDETFSHAERYSGDQPTRARATTVTIDPTLRTVGDATVSRNGGISGTLTGTVPMSNGTVTVYDLDGDQVTATASDVGGAYSITTLRPGSYYLRFSSTAWGGVKFVRTFWPGAASIAGAIPVVVKAGAFKPGINQVLSDRLVAFRRLPSPGVRWWAPP